jgi:hypothetical protein
LGSGVWGLGFGVWGWRFGDLGLEVGVWGLESADEEEMPVKVSRSRMLHEKTFNPKLSSNEVHCTIF